MPSSKVLVLEYDSIMEGWRPRYSGIASMWSADGKWVRVRKGMLARPEWLPVRGMFTKVVEVNDGN